MGVLVEVVFCVTGVVMTGASADAVGVLVVVELGVLEFEIMNGGEVWVKNNSGKLVTDGVMELIPFG